MSSQRGTVSWYYPTKNFIFLPCIQFYPNLSNYYLKLRHFAIYYLPKVQLGTLFSHKSFFVTS